VLLVSSLLNIGYLMPIVVRGFFYSPLGQKDPVVKIGEERSFLSWENVKEAPILCMLPPALTALACIALFVLIDPLYQAILPILKP
jgi:multicomponent Na+:H+ antiporter subunit D